MVGMVVGVVGVGSVVGSVVGSGVVAAASFVDRRALGVHRAGVQKLAPRGVPTPVGLVKLRDRDVCVCVLRDNIMSKDEERDQERTESVWGGRDFGGCVAFRTSGKRSGC